MSFDGLRCGRVAFLFGWLAAGLLLSPGAQATVSRCGDKMSAEQLELLKAADGAGRAFHLQLVQACSRGWAQNVQYDLEDGYWRDPDKLGPEAGDPESSGTVYFMIPLTLEEACLRRNDGRLTWTDQFRLRGQCSSESSEPCEWGPDTYYFSGDIDCLNKDVHRVHESTARVDPGPPPLTAPPDAFISVTSSDGGDGLRAGFRLGLTRRFAVEVAASRQSDDREELTFRSAAVLRSSVEVETLTLDVLGVWKVPISDRWTGLGFVGPGWRRTSSVVKTEALESNVVDGAVDLPVPRSFQSDTFTLSAGLGLEYQLSHRWALDGRVLRRWLAETDGDRWTTEAQLGFRVSLCGCRK